MPDGEQRYIDADMLHPVEKEDHTEQEKDVVIAGDHVLGAQIDVGQQVPAGNFSDIACVACVDAMRLNGAGQGERSSKRHESGRDWPRWPDRPREIEGH